jgi:hypothetical protein
MGLPAGPMKLVLTLTGTPLGRPDVAKSTSGGAPYVIVTCVAGGELPVGVVKGLSGDSPPTTKLRLLKKGGRL